MNFLRATAEDIIKKLASFLNEIKFSDASIEKCPFPCLDYVIFVQGSGPHLMNYADISDAPLKEVIVSRKCAEAVLRGAQVKLHSVRIVFISILSIFFIGEMSYECDTHVDFI